MADDTKKKDAAQAGAQALAALAGAQLKSATNGDLSNSNLSAQGRAQLAHLGSVSTNTLNCYDPWQQWRSAYWSPTPERTHYVSKGAKLRALKAACGAVLVAEANGAVKFTGKQASSAVTQVDCLECLRALIEKAKK